LHDPPRPQAVLRGAGVKWEWIFAAEACFGLRVSCGGGEVHAFASAEDRARAFLDGETANHKGTNAIVPFTLLWEKGTKANVPFTLPRQKGTNANVPFSLAWEKGTNGIVPFTLAWQKGTNVNVPFSLARENGTNANVPF
jgi:hypothetical protein